jgi:threonine dehydratase
VPEKIFDKILRAERRIRADIRWTPLERSPGLSRLTGADVHLKWESLQLTGSFKIRGALNKVRSLSAEERARGAVTASTGNHGLGVSLAARLEGIGLTVVLPSSASAEKRRRLAASGTAIVDHGKTCEEAEVYARRLAAETGRVYISPYNDEEVIAGQGTIGLEVAADFAGAASVLVPVGGGGLVSGIATYLRPVLKSAKILGVEPEASACMAASLAAGKIVPIDEGETIADAVAGGIEPGSEQHGRRVEGAGALPLAALLSDPVRFAARPTVLIISGGNVSPWQNTNSK